jgi:hypothetical protein
MDEARPMLDYSTPPKRARLPFKLFNMLTVLSLIGGAAILFLSALGWEVQLEPPIGGWPHVAYPLYHNGLIYCVDPFWMASFSLILPVIWIKRRVIKAWQSRKTR